MIFEWETRLAPEKGLQPNTRKLSTQDQNKMRNRIFKLEGSDGWFLVEYDFYLINWTRADFAPQIQINEYIRK